MLFNSLNFAVFFAVVFLLYSCLKRSSQNILLLIASYFFYGCWDYRFLALIVISTLVDYGCGLAIERYDEPTVKKRFLIISIVTNLGILAFFKYFNFFIDNASGLFHLFGLSATRWRLNIILPVGISFYTFQTMSYTIDIYRGRLKATRNLIDFAAFVAFFPQLVAGPIERAANLLPQFAKDREISWANIQQGSWLIYWGLFKKAVIADNLALLVEPVYGGSADVTGGSVLVATYAFAFQIYCDFSGYSDMARGLAKCMGFDLMVNFNNPYFAINPSDFWKRWHISLSSWLRDYLYIPLGGNKKGHVRTYINLMLTMLLGGLWHGAAWTFVAWGAYQGGLLVVWRIVANHFNVRRQSLVGRLCQMFIMFQLACLGWIFFRAESMHDVWHMVAVVFTDYSRSPGLGNAVFALILLCLPLWLVQLLQEQTKNLSAVHELSLFPRFVLQATTLVMLLLFGNTGGQAFIYFQF